MAKVMPVFILMALLIYEPAHAQDASHPFAGTFANAEITFSLQAGGTGYTGQVQFDGQTFPVAAQAVQGGIQGTYTYNGQPVPFQAMLQGQTLTILSEGSYFTLNRQASNGQTTTAQPVPQTSSASQGQPGAPSSGTFNDPVWGVRFTPPAGWTGQQDQGMWAYTKAGHSGVLLFVSHDQGTLDDLRAEFQRGVNEAGTQLRTTGPIEAFGSNGLVADVGGTIEGKTWKVRTVGLISPHGRGLTLLGMMPPDAYNAEFTQMVETVARSVVFFAPQVSAEAQEWSEWFAGCRLSYFNSYNSGYGGGGYSDNSTIDLCPGYFTFGESSETVFNTPDLSGSDAYMSDRQRGAGQWEVRMQSGTPTLFLRFHNGEVRSYGLGYDDGKTYLNDRRWLRTCNPNDQVVEARPQCQ